MTTARLPNKCKWAFEDLYALLNQAQHQVSPLVLKSGDHMPSRAYLISRAAHTEREIRKAMQVIGRIHPTASDGVVRSSSNE